MKAQITFIKSIQRGLLYTFKFENGKTAHTYTGSQFRNFRLWEGLKKGDWVDGLRWENEKEKLISADSPVRLLVLS